MARDAMRVGQDRGPPPGTPPEKPLRFAFQKPQEIPRFSQSSYIPLRNGPLRSASQTQFASKLVDHSYRGRVIFEAFWPAQL